MLKRLRVKFVCTNMVIVTIMLCVILALVLNFTRSDLEEQSVRMMQVIAADPWRMGRPGEASDGVRLPYFTLQIGPKGEVVASGGDYYDLSDREFLAELIRAATASGRRTGVLREYGLRYYREVTPVSQHIVFADISSETGTMNSLLRTCLAIGAAGFCVFLLISLFLARWAVRPVERAWEQQRQFVADASHELKTPLTVITTNAELLRDAAGSEADRAQFTDNILLTSRQMRELTESLLELARVDGGAAGMAFAPCDLSRLVESAALPFEAVFFEAGLQFRMAIQDGVRARVSESHIRQVTDILLDNARKYTSPGGQVRLELKRAGRGECLLSVASSGEPISREDLKNIFKRFYRVDSARSRKHSYGLGLSIAQAIVQAHRGKIWAQSADGVNTFFVQLPGLPAA